MENTLQYKLEGFEGPLDLLLQLIARNKLNIYDIPLLELIDQYLEQIKLYEQDEMELGSEFLEMASRLLYIKTVSLLPRHDEVIKLKLNKTLHLWTFDYNFILFAIELTKIKMEKGLDYVFVDEFQLLSPDISANLRAKWLKDLAVSLGITIFVTSQMKRSRDCDRIDCTTVNYHLYYMADKVLGVYRKDYFMMISDMERIKKGESFLCAVKNNAGKQGALTAYFNYARCRFSENFIDEDWYKPTTDIVSMQA
jgi:hypothetical protein